MQILTTPFHGLWVIKPRVFEDERGFFLESWNQKTFQEAGINDAFVQDNQSGSVRNVIRGLHFQVPPYEQGKLVRVIRGAVLDVVVDLRKTQPTFGKHFKITLTAAENNMLFIPPGFAHGFRTLEDDTVFFYKCTQFYHQPSERALRWNDPDLDIDWETTSPILSGKDQKAPFFKDFTSPF
jgi:dTDP-4-dehydrorhamnose 3,5-epimerase